ncbi:hypothetical protein WA026_019586 [Henosepilachna vigintioctopunctata]|uniref:Reverse transcriptase domain-containing protein n=1 Tax=Henosepilachna vigintioctopunctata TaxID=420089 RepID=A0AAW1TVR8_9CUCU
MIAYRLSVMCSITENQYGFVVRKSTIDAIHSIIILMEKHRANKENSHQLFIDLEKSFDRVPSCLCSSSQSRRLCYWITRSSTNSTILHERLCGHKIQVLFDIIDLKARIIHVIYSFSTIENLISLKRFFNWVSGLVTFIKQFLSNLSDDNHPRNPSFVAVYVQHIGGFSCTALATLPPSNKGATSLETIDYVPKSMDCNFEMRPENDKVILALILLPTVIIAAQEYPTSSVL